MSTDIDLQQWLHMLSKRLTALGDTQQRVFLFTERITLLSPDNAARALEKILAKGFCQRDHASKLALEAAVCSLAENSWPESHRSSTLQSADELGEQLSSIYLSHVTMPHPQEDDENFRVPNYNPSRPLTLGERRSLASQPNRSLIELAVLDPHPMVIEKLLINPKLKEDDVVFMATRRPAPPATLARIAINTRWRPCARVAVALVYNPALPDWAALTLLPSITTHQVAEIARNTKLSDLLRQTSVAFLKKRGNI